MGLKYETMTIKWHHMTKNHFVSKGYIFTAFKDEFEIKIIDLPEGSAILVDCECDNCSKPLKREWRKYLESINDYGKTYCSTCAKKLVATKRSLETTLKNGKSFEKWCIENKRHDVLKRWNEELNNCKPSEVCFSSTKKYYFNCSRKLHEPELKDINGFTNKNQNGYIECKKCNSFAQYLIDTYGENAIELYWDQEKNDELGIDVWNISHGSKKEVYIICQEKQYHHSYPTKPFRFTSRVRCSYCKGLRVHPKDSLGQYIFDKYGEKFLWKIWSNKNKKSPFEYMPMSHSEVWWKCPNCKHEDYKRKILSSKTYDFRCPSCEFSKGEKKIDSYLIENNIKYISQQKYDGLIGTGGGLLSYDFFLQNHNLLIEYQGEQHYEFIKGLHNSIEDFNNQLEHDRRKRNYAKQNNIRLLEIPYWDFDNISTILSQELNIQIESS